MYRGEEEAELREKLSQAIARGDHFRDAAVQAKGALALALHERNVAVAERHFMEQQMQALRVQHSTQTRKWLVMAVMFGALLLNSLLRYL